MTDGSGAGSPRRLLVTGGSGFIGRHVVAEMMAGGREVRVVDLNPHPNPAVPVTIGDIAEPGVLDEAFKGGVDAVVHLAALTSVLRSVGEPDATFRTNVAGTSAVLEQARRRGVATVVFASTNAVAGPVEGGPITEDIPLRPLTPYGATKAAAEMLLSCYDTSYGVRTVALRLTNVYGTGMAAKDSIVARLMRSVLSGSTFGIYGDGLQRRDYVHVSDVVAAVRSALADNLWRGPTVIGSGSSVSVLELLDAVREVTGSPLDARHEPARPGEMPAVVVNISRAVGRGWSPTVALKDGLKGVWEEWSEGGGR